MKIKTFSLIIPIIIIPVVIMMFGCSQTVSPTSPDMDELTLGAFPETGHQVLGVWDILVDTSGVTVTSITDRYLDGNTHFNVKKFLKPPFCSDCLTISNVSNDEDNSILTADVTLRNPYPIAGADVRGIVLSNVDAIYLANPDDYTTLYDKDDPPDINPFRLFGKDLTDGIVGPDVEITETFQLHYDEIPFFFSTAADAIYPVAATREPYAIMNQTIDGDFDTMGFISRKIEADVYDRNDDAGTISVVCEELGIDTVLMEDGVQEDHYYTYLSNSTNQPAGEYTLMIAANDALESWIIYDYLTLMVSDEIGEWVISQYSVPDQGCSMQFACGFDLMTGSPSYYYPGGSTCNAINITDMAFSTFNQYFSLADIDPLVADFNPYPVARIDASLAGGLAFFADSDAPYDDGFYSGPVSSLMVTLVPGMTGEPEYINPGDGDAGRMYPGVAGLIGVDVTDDLQGNLYGLWADPDGILPPEIYGLTPDFTRHDVFMGGALPPELVGEGPGKISPVWDNIKAISVSGFMMDAGTLNVLESSGSSSEIEVINFTTDFDLKITVFELKTTVTLGGLDAVDLEEVMFNPLYYLNPEFDSLAVLVNGSSGGYVRMYNLFDYSFLEEIGSGAEPVIAGTPASLDTDNFNWGLLLGSEGGNAAFLSWELN